MDTITVDEIINSLNEPLALIDFNGRIIDANDLMAKLVGFKRKQIIGEYAVSFWSRFHLNELKDGLERTKTKGHLENLAGVLVAKKGKEVPVVFNASLMKDITGKPYAILVIVKDISKLKKHIDTLKETKNLLKDKIFKKKQDIIESNHKLTEANKQLKETEGALRILFKQIKETERLKSIYLSGLSEEFYNPLLSITGFTSILKEKVSKTPDSERAFLRDIKNHADYLLEVLESLNDLLKVEKDKIEIKMQKTDLFVIYSNLKNIYQSVLEFNKNIELEFVFPYEPIPEVYVDRAKLKLVMINLINTAVAHVGCGKISVKVFNNIKEGNILTLVETQYAQSETEDVLFERLAELFKNKDKISGLGLEKTKKIIEAMNGHLSFDSRDDGKIVAAKFTLASFDQRKKQQSFLIPQGE